MPAKDGEGTARRRIAALLAAWSRDVFSGLIASVLAIAYGLSFAALIFAPPLSTWIAYGLAATFITTAVGGLQLRYVARDALLDPLKTPLHLGLGEVLIARIDSLEF